MYVVDRNKRGVQREDASSSATVAASTRAGTWHSTFDTWHSAMQPAPSSASTQSEYTEWEKAVCASFFERVPRRTPLIPTDEAPSVVCKLSYVVIADVDCLWPAKFQLQPLASNRIAAASEGSPPRGLPPSQHVMLWHGGKSAAVKAKLGIDAGVFSHPAYSATGPTTQTQRLGERLAFVGGEASGICWPAAGLQSDDLAARLYEMWTRLSRRDLPTTLRGELCAWLDTVSSEMNQVVIRFYALPPEYHVVATARDVIARTGRCLVDRTHGPAARPSDGIVLYCLISETRVQSELTEADGERVPTRNTRPPAARCDS